VDGGGGASDTALEWVQVLAPVWVLLGVVLGYYLTSRARRTAFNEQHVGARVEAARDSFMAAHLAAYHIANRLRLDDGQELADLWTPELARQIDDLVWQLYDHESMLNGRQARPVAATFGEARKLIHEITREAGKPDRPPAAERTQRHQVALIQLFRLLQRAPRCWDEWERTQWDLVSTRLARLTRRLRARKR
jgi:hypothetical protein